MLLLSSVALPGSFGPDPELDLILNRILDWIWSWTGSWIGSVTAEEVDPVASMAGEATKIGTPRPEWKCHPFNTYTISYWKVHEFRQQILQQTLSSVLQQNYCRFPRTQENCFLDVRLKLKTSIILFTATERQSQRVHVLSRICAQRTFYPGKFEKIKESTRDLPHLQSCFFLYFACCWISIVVQDLSYLVLVPEQV